MTAKEKAILITTFARIDEIIVALGAEERAVHQRSIAAIYANYHELLGTPVEEQKKEPALKKCASREELEKGLKEFDESCSIVNNHYTKINGDFNAYSNGVKYLMDKGGLEWFVDFVMTKMSNDAIFKDQKKQDYMAWKLETELDGSALIAALDKSGVMFYWKELEGVKFPLPKLELIYVDGDLMLPSEM